VTEGLFDEIALDRVGRAEADIRQALRDQLAGDIRQRILDGDKLDDSDRNTMLGIARGALDQALPAAATKTERDANNGTTGSPEKEDQ
jgi:hypothetical protein